MSRGTTKRKSLFAAGVCWLAACGCSSVPAPVAVHTPEPTARDWRTRAALQATSKPTTQSTAERIGSSGIVPAGGIEAETAPKLASPAGVDDFVSVSVTRNPRLAKAAFAIDAASGRFVQAGLYPNPEFAMNWDEAGDRTGPGGIVFPKLSQTIVTGHKLSLAQAVAATEVNQANLGVLTERYAVIGSVRASFYDVYAQERRIAVLDELVQLTERAVRDGKALLEKERIARLDLVPLEVEASRAKVAAESARRALPAARQALAATVGDPRLSVGGLSGPFEALPDYDLDTVRDVVLASHPQVQAARVGVERARAAVRQAEAEPIPNVNVYAGYIRQYENQSNDFALGLSAPIPIWNRNQGNIRAAKAELGSATHEVGRVENALAERVAAAFRVYVSARLQAELYRTEIIPKAVQSYDLSMEAFRGGQFEYLRVIQAQRTISDARLEYVTALGRAWQAAAELSGLLLEESWPGLQPGPSAGPAQIPPPRRVPDVGPNPR